MSEIEHRTYAEREITAKILLELGVPTKRSGFQQLCTAITHFAQNPSQLLTKELYPYVAEQCNLSNGICAERSIRTIITDSWQHGPPEAWMRYFPNQVQPPSNKQFISTLAEQLTAKRSSEIWMQDFPDSVQPPSNKPFVSTLDKKLTEKRIPPVSRRGRNARRRRHYRAYYLRPVLVVRRPKRWEMCK